MGETIGDVKRFGIVFVFLLFFHSMFLPVLALSAFALSLLFALLAVGVISLLIGPVSHLNAF